MTDDELANHEVPNELGERMQTALDLEARPATLAEFVDATADRLDDAGFEVGYEELCTTEESRHVATVDGDEQAFHCVLDTFLLPFVRGDAPAIDVRSDSPVSDAVVEFTVTPERVDADPADAVVSLGVTDGIEGPVAGEIDADVAYERLCPYINAFASRGEYDRWAEETAATTMAFPAETGFELARALVETGGYETGDAHRR